MELIQGKSKASKFTEEDFISNMPDNVVTNILDRLPLQDAVMTSILARNWRLKWKMLSQLVFDEDFFKYLCKRKHRNSYGRIISRLLLHLKGVIKKFVIFIERQSVSVLNDDDINHWMMFLSENGINDLTIHKWNGLPFKLPTHLFSCLDLKHLKLIHCSWHPPTSFQGFPKLLSLELDNATLRSKEFDEFSTMFPVLEILRMTNSFDKPKLADIAKLTKLQQLELDFFASELPEGGVKERFSTIFPCLRTLKLSGISLAKGKNLSCAFEMIRCSPNLQTLEISGSRRKTVSTSTQKTCFPEKEHDSTGLLLLRNVVFTCYTGSEGEVCLMKYLLACSHLLKKVVIRLHPRLLVVEKVRARSLLELHRASPVAEIDFC